MEKLAGWPPSDGNPEAMESLPVCRPTVRNRRICCALATRNDGRESTAHILEGFSGRLSGGMILFMRRYSTGWPE